jgi:hypothetical protein
MGPKDVVQVGGVDRTQQDCYLEALCLDPTNTTVRGNVERSLGV